MNNTIPICCVPGCGLTGLHRLLPIRTDGDYEYLCAQHVFRQKDTPPPVLDSHYRTLSPEPIVLMQQWGLTGPFACATILKLVARIWACNRPDRPKATGYNNRGSLEDITKLRFYVDQLEQWLLAIAKEKETPAP